MKRFVLSALLALCSAGSWAAPGDASTDWVPCAREGQTCYTPGPAQVRFGVDGKFSPVKNAVGNIECDIETFGDPARRVFKSCEYKMGWARGIAHPPRDEDDNKGWTDCAQEGGVCKFRGTRVVRFGADGAYYYRTENREIPCTLEEFGDPVRRVVKHCQFKNDRPLRDNDARQDSGEDREPRPVGAVIPANPPSPWANCGAEGTTCRVSAPTMVRFGNRGNYHYRQVDREVRCSAQLFGDPAPGQRKDCEANTMPQGQAAGRKPDPSEIPPFDDARWAFCAKDGQVCNFRGGEHVRFGARGVYQVRYANGGIRCDDRSFGSDPLPGFPKSCSVYRP